MNNIDFSNYINSGVPGELNKDFGDSAQRIGMISFGKFLNETPNESEFNFWLSLITVGPGQFVRGPAPGWWNNPLNFSRDQTRALVMAMGVYKKKGALKANFFSLIKNFGLYPNIYPNWVKPGDSGYVKKFPDIASPEHYSEYIRAFYSSGNNWMLALYPLVLLGDLFKLLGTLIAVFYTDRDPTQADDLNSIMSLLQAYKYLPTPLSWLSRKIYAKFRPVIPNNQGITDGPNSAMATYFGGPNSIKPMVDLYKSLIDAYIINS